MKLIINFMIKDGKRIISRDTKGYKVMLNRIVKEFAKIKHLPQKQVEIKVIIQTSKQAAYNNSGKNYVKIGWFNSRKMEIIMIKNNASSPEMFKAFLAHEFGHAFQYKNDYLSWAKLGVIAKERYADKFAEKITGINPQSKTGKIRSIAAMNRSK